MCDLGVIELSVTLADWNPIFLGILTLSAFRLEMEVVAVVWFSPCFASYPVLPFTI